MQDNAWEESVAHNVQRVLMPVHPSDTFRSHLRSNLQLAGQQQVARRAMRIQQPPAINVWVLGAAALGVTLAAGSMVALAIRARALPPH